MKKILVLGQTPPPFHGQAIAIERMLQGKYHHAQLVHVRMGFARDNNDLGTVRLGKILHLLSLIAKITFNRIYRKTQILYYPPSGPKAVAIYRDILLLTACRWMFKKTIFHFHASGLSDYYPNLNPVAKYFFHRAFNACDIAIILSDNLPPDHICVQAIQKKTIPNGIPDRFIERNSKRAKTNIPRILFVGLLTPSKGLFILLEACLKLKTKGISFALDIVGMFPEKDIEYEFEQIIQSNELKDVIKLHGVLKGEELEMVYTNADVFCLPTFYESEAFPLVVLEAMQHKLPVVSTRWRGIVDQVEDGKSGFLIPIKNVEALVDKLEVLLQDEELRISLGQYGRSLYLKNYTIDRFYKNLDDCFASV